MLFLSFLKLFSLWRNIEFMPLSTLVLDNLSILKTGSMMKWSDEIAFEKIKSELNDKNQ